MCYARAKPTLTLVPPDTGPLEAMVELVRAPARQRGDTVAAGTFATADGRIVIEWRESEYVRVSFLDDEIRSRTYGDTWPA